MQSNGGEPDKRPPRVPINQHRDPASIHTRKCAMESKLDFSSRKASKDPGEKGGSKASRPKSGSGSYQDKQNQYDKEHGEPGKRATATSQDNQTGTAGDKQ